MKRLKDYCKNCTIEQIGEVKCSISGLIKVSENNCVSMETEQLSRELYQQMQHNDDKVICLKTIDYHVTIIGYWVVDKHTRGGENVIFSATCEAKKSFWGDRYCIVPNNGFEEFSLKVTDGVELIGLTPYGELDIENILFRGQSPFHVDTRVKQIHEKTGFSCFVAPDIERLGTDIRLGIQYRLYFSQGCKLSIDDIEEKIHSLVLLLEILCGERIAVTEIEVSQDEMNYIYLGRPMMPKASLNAFKQKYSDSYGYVRRKIFKLSDFDTNEESATSKFEKMYVEDGVAFGAYQQLLMDDELQIFTVNNFLKAMQMVEGIERLGDRKKAHKEFKKIKDSIVEKLSDEDDKKFILEYCNDQGEGFRECLDRITNNCFSVLSENDNSCCSEIISSIKKDRDVYTHASHKNKPLLSQSELRGVTYCFKSFFRIEVLMQLGLNEELIRKRFSYDRLFVAYYENLFGQTIKLEDGGTGEYDDIMQSNP